MLYVNYFDHKNNNFYRKRIHRNPKTYINYVWEKTHSFIKFVVPGFTMKWTDNYHRSEMSVLYFVFLFTFLFVRTTVWSDWYHWLDPFHSIVDIKTRFFLKDVSCKPADYFRTPTHIDIQKRPIARHDNVRNRHA